MNETHLDAGAQNVSNAGLAANKMTPFPYSGH